MYGVTFGFKNLDLAETPQNDWTPNWRINHLIQGKTTRKENLLSQLTEMWEFQTKIENLNINKVRLINWLQSDYRSADFKVPVFAVRALMQDSEFLPG